MHTHTHTHTHIFHTSMWHDSRDLIIATFSKRTWKISYIINMFSFSFTHYTISYLGKNDLVENREEIQKDTINSQ